MTWNEKRIVTILSTILAVLVAALLVVLSIRYRQNRDLQAENPTLAAQGVEVEKSDYTSLYLDNGSFSPSFALGEGGKWTWSDRPDFPLDSTVVEEILALLDDLKPQQTLPIGDGSIADYALESPRATVTATRADGSERTVQLGKSTTDGKSYYALIDGDETTVYILDGKLLELISVPVYDMMALPVLPELHQEKLVSVTVQGRLGDNAAAPVLTLVSQPQAGEQAAVRWFAGSDEVTENPLVQGLLSDLAHLTLTKCVDYAPTPGAVEICGLTDPAALVTAVYRTDADAEQEFQFAVGERVPDGSGRYMQLTTGSDDTIYFLPTEALDPLMHVAASGLTA